MKQVLGPWEVAAMPGVVRVLGLGNVLVGDDAFGPWVIHVLTSIAEAGPDVEFHDLGTPGLDLLPYLTGADAVILVDTVRSPGEPGELRRYDKAQILRHAPQPRVSPHDPGVKEALLALEFEGRCPGVVILVGAVSGEVRYEVGLSEPVRAAVGSAAEAVVKELTALGCRVTRRADATVPPPWWET
jgi:hydrogenase maturation protease